MVTRGEGDKLQALPASLRSTASALHCSWLDKTVLGTKKGQGALVVLSNREMIRKGFSVSFGGSHACPSSGLCFQIKVARSQPGRGFCWLKVGLTSM